MTSKETAEKISAYEKLGYCPRVYSEVRSKVSGLLYVACAYSYDKAAGYDVAAKTVHRLLDFEYFASHVFIFSPILHWHHASQYSNVPLPTDAHFWRKQNAAQLAKADALLVCLPGPIDTSVGVQFEIGMATGMGIPVFYTDYELLHQSYIIFFERP